MDRRIGQLAGLFAATLVLLRLNRLLLSGPEYPNWQVILLASAVLGGVVWWLLVQLLPRTWMSMTLFALGGVVLFLRIAVPETLVAGVLPSATTLDVLLIEMEQAFRLIRFGVPPIDPVSGVIAILAILMWAIGATYTWGLTGGPVGTMMVPSLVVYLQFAVFDREPAGPVWMTFSAAVLTLSIVALGLERRAETGRVRDQEGRPLPRRSHALALVTAGSLGIGAVLLAAGASSVVSEYGNVPWRSGGSLYGEGGGGVTFDRFADLIQKSLVDQPENILFQATLAPGAPPANQVYWPMERLDVFDGTGWKRSTTSASSYEPGQPVGDPAHAYQGTTSDILALVQVEDLRQEVAPAPGVTTQIHSLNIGNAIEPRSFRVGQDSALIYQPRLAEGDRYQVTASYAMTSQDLGALATLESGELSPIFAEATDAGLFTAEPETIEREVTRPDDLDFFTDLPDDLPANLSRIARRQTAGATTDFEKAWMLENWFRDPDQFEYSIDVSSGHSSLNLADWLDDPDSLNHRTGYCEQFATSMTVLGRTLGIPSRVVWGFTPGSTVIQEDTNEVIQVRGTNAHAWVEMWMDGFGWVRFDPTPRSDAINQPTASFDAAPFVPLPSPNLDTIDPEFGGNFGDELVEPVPTSEPGGESPRWWLFGILGLALLLPVIPTVKAIRRRRRIRLIREGDITAAWDEIVDRLTDLGEPVSPHLTPMEVAGTTDPALLSIAIAYSATIYGGRPGRSTELDLLEAEAWLHDRFNPTDRAKAALTPKSLFGKG